MHVNKVILIGNLGRDPEIRRLASGDAIASFSVATSERWKDKDTGEKKERTEWHSVQVFNQNLVPVVEKHLHKGSKVYVEGTLQTRKWTDKTGVERWTTEIVLTRFRGEIVLLDAPASTRPPPATSADDYGTAKSGERPATGAGAGGGMDDGIPF